MYSIDHTHGIVDLLAERVPVCHGSSFLELTCSTTTIARCGQDFNMRSWLLYPRVVAFAISVRSSTSGRSDCGMDVSLTCTVWMEFPATTVMRYSYSSGLARRSLTTGTS